MLVRLHLKQLLLIILIGIFGFLAVHTTRQHFFSNPEAVHTAFQGKVELLPTAVKKPVRADISNAKPAHKKIIVLSA